MWGMPHGSRSTVTGRSIPGTVSRPEVWDSAARAREASSGSITGDGPPARPRGAVSRRARKRADSRARTGMARSAHLAHQCQRVALRIEEEGHPQLVVGHLGQEVRLVDELGAAALQGLVGGSDVVHLVIEDGSGMVELRRL